MVSRSFSTITFTVATAIVLFSATPVRGHGFLMKPKPAFKPGVYESSYTGTILGDATYPGSKFNGEWKDNIAAFTKRFKSDTRHPDLKTLIAKNQKLFADGIADATCGYTDPTKSHEVLEGDSITYGRYIEGKREGFVHPGPCETWCDNNMVQQDMDCMTTYKAPYGTPATIPIDAAKCKGAKQLTTYWLGIQNNEWQIYINCVGLSGATNNSSSNSSTPAATSSAPSRAPTTRAPTATPVPASGSDTNEYANDSTPAPAKTTAPAKTPTPSQSSSKCTTKSARQLKH